MKFMNLTVQVKKYRKKFEEVFSNRMEDRQLLETINKKLDILLQEIQNLKGEKRVFIPRGGVNHLVKDMEQESNDPTDLYIPDVEIDNMEVKATTKVLENTTDDIKERVDILNRLEEEVR